MKKLVKKYRLSIFICIIFIIIEMITELLLPLILSDTINIGILNNNTNYILVNILIMCIILVIGIFGSIMGTYLSSKISSNICYELRNKIINKVLKLSYKDIDELDIGHTITLVTNDIINIENIIFLILKILIKVPLIIIGSVILCITLSIKMSSILLIIVPIIIIVSIIFIKKTYPYFNLTSICLDNINSNIRENINNIKLIKAENKEEYEIKKFDINNTKYKTIDTKALKTISLMMPIIMFIINITIILILIYSKNNNIKIGTLTAFIEYVNLLLVSIISTSMIFLLTVQSSVSIKRIKNLLNKEEEITNRGIIKPIEGNIEFKNVYFSYNNQYNLENINLKINKGEKVAIIGSSGSGKTTLINLLKNYYSISKGKILIDDIDINKYDLNHLKEHISIVSQKNNLFKNTINDNLKFNKKISIDKYINFTCSNKIIKNKQYVEQNGKNLSGGERQRLILCRTLIMNPDILILDDSLSAVDLNTEKTIINNLLKLDKTIIFISSRIRSIKDFDKIVLLDNGKIQDIGTHKELLNNSIYQELYKMGSDIS